MKPMPSSILIFMLHWRRQSTEHSLPSRRNAINVIFYSEQEDLLGHLASHRTSMALNRSSLLTTQRRATARGLFHGHQTA